jgi:tRNA (guanine-N7-)-methyltransferase
MRKKPNLIPRMERCAAVFVSEPEALRGRWAQTFPDFRSLHLELGCGKGLFTAETARRNPGTLLVAVEKVPDAMVVAMERVCEGGIPNVRFLDRDAAGLSSIFAPGEMERIYINFPDPWPKSRQFKRRLTAPSFLALYAALLPPGGEIWFKTDNGPLFDWSLEQFEAGGWTLREVTRDLHGQGPQGVMTDYEHRFLGQGVPIKRLVAVRTEDMPCDSSHGM